MPTRTSEDDVADARTVMAESNYPLGLSDERLTEEVCDRIKREFNLDLLTNWNPSTCVFDARWEYKRSPVDGLERPYSAEILEHARLLACAGVLKLKRSI